MTSLITRSQNRCDLTPFPSLSIPTSSKPTMADYQALKSAATALCTDFATGKDAPNLLSHFSTHESPVAIEHGLPCLAPFLGREFKGTNEVEQYFELLSEQLSFRNMEFDEYVVDTQQLKVSVKGKARFIWISTGDAWDETFTYTLDFVKEDDDALKVRRYQVWADTGAGEYLINQLSECQSADTGCLLPWDSHSLSSTRR